MIREHVTTHGVFRPPEPKRDLLALHIDPSHLGLISTDLPRRHSAPREEVRWNHATICTTPQPLYCVPMTRPPRKEWVEGTMTQATARDPTARASISLYTRKSSTLLGQPSLHKPGSLQCHILRIHAIVQAALTAHPYHGRTTHGILRRPISIIHEPGELRRRGMRKSQVSLHLPASIAAGMRTCSRSVLRGEVGVSRKATCSKSRSKKGRERDVPGLGSALLWLAANVSDSFLEMEGRPVGEEPDVDADSEIEAEVDGTADGDDAKPQRGA